MSVASPKPGLATVTDAALEAQVRAACEELCRRIRSPAGGSAEELLAEYPLISARPESALELIYTEFLERQDLGQETSPSDWIARFPQWQSDLEELFQVHQHVSESAVAISKGPPRRSAGLPPALSIAASRSQNVAGDYELLEEIGRGGMGVVHRARHVSLDRIVALKLIRFGGAASDDEMTRFRREAESTARLLHPNIVQIFDSGELNGCPFLSMEFVDGGNLAERLARAPMLPQDAAGLVEKVALAVGYAHQHGIVHRDLKPQNVLLTADGIPKVTDFGLAKQQLEASHSLTRTGAILGTPCYMAPEQALGNLGNVGPLTDVYSLGAIFYETLTGRPPFKAATVLETLEQVRSHEPSSITRVQPRVPRDLATICHKCLEKVPARRYPSAVALAEDIHRFLSNVPIHARRSSTTEKLLKWARRRPVTAAFSGILVAVLAAWMISATVLWLRADQRRAEAERLWHETVSARQAEAAQHERAEVNLYARQIGLAHQEWETNHVARADQLLEQCDAARRDWEWQYLKRLCHMDVMTLGGLKQQGRRVEYSCDGRLIATCTGEWGTSDPGEVFVWEAATGRQLHRWEVSAGPTFQVRFSSDGRRLVACASAFRGPVIGKAIVWDLIDGREVLSLASGNTFAVAFSPDDKRIATAGADRTVRIWDAESGAEIRTIAAHRDNVFDVCYSPDGKLIASASRDATARLWDAETGEAVGSPMLGPLDIRCLAFSPDGLRLATGSYNSMIRVWSTKSCRELLTYHGHKTAVTSLAFSPDGRLIASCDWDWHTRLWRADTGADVQTLRGHSANIGGVAFRPDDLRIATSAGDGTVRVWNPAGQQESQSVAGVGSNVMALSNPREPDQPIIGVGTQVPGDPKELAVWEVAQGKATLKLLKGHAAAIRHVAVSADGKTAVSAAANGSLHVWDLAAQKPRHVLSATSNEAAALAISADGAFAAVNDDSSIMVFDLAAGRQVARLNGHAYAVSSIVFDETAKHLASGSEDGSLQVWQTTTWSLVWRNDWQSSPVRELALDGDRRSLAVSRNSGVVEIWNCDDDRPANVARGPRCELKAHTGAVTSLAFSADGRRIASVSGDRTLRLWDTTSGTETLSLRQGPARSRVCFRRGGNQLMTIGEGIRIWDLAPSFHTASTFDRLALATRDDADAPVTLAAATDLQESELAIHEAASLEAERARQWFSVAFHLNFLIAAQPHDANLWFRRGSALAEIATFEDAARDFSVARRLGKEVASHEARARLAQGDEAFFRQFCSQSLALEPETQGWLLTNAAAWCCALAPDAVGEPEQAVRLAEWSLANADMARRSNCLNTLGGVLYRAGRYREAIDRLQESMNASPNSAGIVEDWLFLTLAYAQLGEMNEAKRWWDKTESWWSSQMLPALEVGPLPLHWASRLACSRLRAEAQMLLSTAPPAR